MLKPTQSVIARSMNLLLYWQQTHNPRTLHWLRSLLGDRFPLYGGKSYCAFYEVQALLAAEYEPLDWFCGPIDDRADYLTKSYAPFLMSGPNRRLRQAHVAARVQSALTQLDDLDALLADGGGPERALARFAFRHLG